MRSSVLCLGLVLALAMGCSRTQTQHVRLWLRDEPGRACVAACQTTPDDYACLRQCPGALESRGDCGPYDGDGVVCVEKDVRVVRKAATAGTVAGVVVAVVVVAYGVLWLAMVSSSTH